MPEERREETSTHTGSRQTSKYIGAAKSGADIDSRQRVAGAGTTAGKGLGTMGKAFVPPKQEKDEPAGAYSRRVREARAAHEQGQAQKKAITQ